LYFATFYNEFCVCIDSGNVQFFLLNLAAMWLMLSEKSSIYFVVYVFGD